MGVQAVEVLSSTRVDETLQTPFVVRSRHLLGSREVLLQKLLAEESSVSATLHRPALTELVWEVGPQQLELPTKLMLVPLLGQFLRLVNAAAVGIHYRQAQILVPVFEHRHRSEVVASQYWWQLLIVHWKHNSISNEHISHFRYYPPQVAAHWCCNMITSRPSQFFFVGLFDFRGIVVSMFALVQSRCSLFLCVIFAEYLMIEAILCSFVSLSRRLLSEAEFLLGRGLSFRFGFVAKTLLQPLRIVRALVWVVRLHFDK